MGSVVVSICGKTDFFQNLLEKYGDDFVKLIVSQKAKMQLEQKFKQIIAKIAEYVTVFELKVNTIVDEKLKYLQQKFEEIKTKVNQWLPDGIPSLQRQKGKSINDFSGFNSVIEHIDSIRDRTLQQVQQKRVQIEKQLLQKKTMIYNEIQEQRPKVPLYQTLSDETRFKILSKGEREFKQQIEKRQRELDDKCDQSCGENFSDLDKFLDQANPESFLDDLIEQGLKDMVKKVTGGGKFGAFCDKFF